MNDGLDSLYPLVDRLRCQYLGRDFSGEMLVTLPTAIMLEAAKRIEELEADLTFAYKRAKVLADICDIPVHESPEVTGTILLLVRGHVERLVKRIAELEAEVTGLHNQILDTGPMLPKRGMTLRYVE